MKLTCERTREVLWPLDRPRNHLPEEEAARSHLTRCHHCRAFFLRDAELARLLRRVGEGIAVAPTTGLRMAVAEALASQRWLDAVRDVDESWAESPADLVDLAPEESRPRSRGWRSELAAAAVAVLLLGGGHVLSDRYDTGSYTDRFAADYVRTAAVDFEQSGLDVSQIGQFYDREMGRVIVPVVLHQAPVTRATVCDLRGDLGSMIEYDLEGTRLVHYRVPLEHGGQRMEPNGVMVASRRGVQVAHWTDGDFENALVSEAPGAYLAWLAENRFSRRPAVTNYGSPASRSWRRVELTATALSTSRPRSAPHGSESWARRSRRSSN
ncbi:MAG: hypothetical protein V3T20_03295 [Gemmatimonadota bacterium]